MSGRMRDSGRFVQNEDGSWTRVSSRHQLPGDYDDMSKAELVELAEVRGLTKSGNKADLIARLEEDDAA